MPTLTETKKKKEAAAGLHKHAHVISRPRITEKASVKTDAHVYTFNVASGANKISVAKAIKELYNVTPIRVNILPIPRKSTFIRGKKGMKGGGRKAYVYLKKGDVIEFV
jgi:large subunit ribosomal protein L23